MFSTWSETVKE